MEIYIMNYIQSIKQGKIHPREAPLTQHEY